MNTTEFVKLGSREKKRIIKSAIRGANNDQKRLVEKYNKKHSTKK